MSTGNARTSIWKTYIDFFRMKQRLLAKEMSGYSESEDVCAQFSETVCIAILFIHGCRLHAQGVMCEYVEKEVHIPLNLGQRRKSAHLDERLVVDVDVSALRTREVCFIYPWPVIRSRNDCAHGCGGRR